jgi:hypothetical protein
MLTGILLRSFMHAECDYWVCITYLSMVSSLMSLLATMDN